MVAIIHNSGSLRNALHYNENKVSKGVAECIHSMSFPKDTEQLSFKDKFNRLNNLNLLNQQTKINTVHISLNFDSSDKLSLEKLLAISETYMQKIGFGDQPYLVYQHHDAGHPHIHIVTTNIKSDGRRIELHNLARNQSMKASKEIEKQFHLIEALSKSRVHRGINHVNAQKVQYGKSETKRAITNVLDAVLPYYKYASIPELNAILRDYNITADVGGKESRTYRRGGLVYRVLNGKGEKVGVPVKASLIYNKPTLSVIQKRFAGNKEERERYKQRITTSVDLAFARQPDLSMASLQQSLQKEGIHLHLRMNDADIIYGLTYVDHRTKCVFNGNELGKKYSANAVQHRMTITQTETAQQPVLRNARIASFDPVISKERHSEISPGIIQHLTQSDTQPLATELKEEQKRKRKKKQQL